MDLKSLQKNWNEWAKTDPLWAILALRGKKGKKWDIDEFFGTGEKEIDLVMEYTKSLGFNAPRRRALDFGCGVGRTTQPLAKYFEEVYGVDIAPYMIELAKKYNRHGDKCKYYLNETDNLILFPDGFFNFIYSNITLQHMHPRYSRNYIKEFLRTLVPSGMLVFQLPSRPRTIKGLIMRIIPYNLQLYYCRIRYLHHRAILDMHGIKREEVVKFLEQNGGKVLDIQRDERAGEHWISFRYCVAKK